jgi:CheY-like chemotaxis protein
MKQCTIFVIENDIATRDFMLDILSDEGYTVYGCAWAGATIEAVAEVQPQLAIVDLSPVEPDSVISFLTRLRQHHATHHIRVLVGCTSTHLLNHLEAPLQHLGCQIMLKPFDLEAFLHYVTMLCTDALNCSAA